MTAQRLVHLYETGAITLNTLLLRLLLLIDPAFPDAVLGSLPDQYLRQFRDFLAGWQVGKMMTNYGPLPADEQVIAAREWLARAATPAGV